MDKPPAGRSYAQASNACYESYRQRLRRSHLQPGEPYPPPTNPASGPHAAADPTETA